MTRERTRHHHGVDRCTNSSQVVSARSMPLTPAMQRTKAACLCFGLLLGSAQFSGAKAALPTAPEASIQKFYATLLTTMKSGAALGKTGRYAQLAPIVPELFDLPYMARLATGPSWLQLDPSQQQRIITAFGHYIAATYADRFDSYSGEQLRVIATRPAADASLVQTQIIKSDGQPVTLNYLMRQNAGAWQITDVYLDGTISQLAVQRSEFSAILRAQGADGLIASLNRKTDRLTTSS